MFKLGALDAGSDGGGVGVFRLGSRGEDVRLRGDSGFILVLDNCQDFVVVLDGFVEQTLEFILGSQGEIVGGECGLRRQAGRGEVGCAGLGAGFVAFHGAADFAPDIEAPACAC